MSDVNRIPAVEPWVDAETVAAHLGVKPDHIRKLARAGKLPGVQMGNGKREFWRFKLSAVDVAMTAPIVRIDLSPLAVTHFEATR